MRRVVRVNGRVHKVDTYASAYGVQNLLLRYVMPGCAVIAHHAAGVVVLHRPSSAGEHEQLILQEA